MSGAKYALVTGGNRGIGLELCKQLVAKGKPVLFTARNADQGTGWTKTAGPILKALVTSHVVIANALNDVLPLAEGNVAHVWHMHQAATPLLLLSSSQWLCRQKRGRELDSRCTICCREMSRSGHSRQQQHPEACSCSAAGV
jgi:hypothetical protein